jgi:antirestriction protein ArdC
MTTTDLYARVTDRIISDLEKGRPGASPQWNALPGNQHPAFVGVGHRQGIQLQYMNDLQAGA